MERVEGIAALRCAVLDAFDISAVLAPGRAFASALFDSRSRAMG